MVFILFGKKASKLFLLFFFLFAFWLLLTESKALQNEAEQALVFCAEVLVPTLFPFAVLSRFLLLSGALSFQNKAVTSISNALHLPSELFPAYLVGLFCGFPIGAYAACSLYVNNLTDPHAAFRSATLSNNASLAFLFGTAGELFGSAKCGMILFVSQTAATLLISLIPPKKRAVVSPAIPKAPPPLFSLAADSIAKGGIAMLTLTAFTVFFATVKRALLLCRLPSFFLLLLEPTSAVILSAEAEKTLGTPIALALAAASLGFSGLSVIMQTQALFWGKLPLFYEIRTRAAIGCLSFVIAFFLAYLLL